jgi:hypothetical protein
MPQCQGNTALRPGAETRLTCQAQYSGVLQPVLTWIRDGIEIDSQDDYDILLARRWVSVPPVTDQEDGVEYTCHVKFGSVVEQCRLRLDVACKYIDQQYGRCSIWDFGPPIAFADIFGIFWGFAARARWLTLRILWPLERWPSSEN